MWPSDGVALCNATWNNLSPVIASDGKAGAVVAWLSDYTGTYDIYAQRVTASGTPIWFTCGSPICTAFGHQSSLSMAAADGGSVVIAWADGRSGDLDVYAQKVDSLGISLWTSDGEPVCTLSSLQLAPRVAYDGAGGVVMGWEDLRVPDGDVYAQRLDATGTALWTPNGQPVCLEGSYQWAPTFVARAEAERFIVAWRDGRNDVGDIYAQLIDGIGRTGYLPPAITAAEDVADDQGGKLIVQWSKSDFDTLPQAEVSFYSVWRRLPLYASTSSAEGQSSFNPSHMRVDFEGTARRAAGGYSWEWLGNVPARYFDSYSLLVTSLSDSMGSDPHWQYFMVTAHTDLAEYYYDSDVDSGYSVDNLSPQAPSPVAGDQQVNPSGLLLHWPASSAPDISHYAVYRGSDETFVPGPANLIASVQDTSYLDGSWTWDSGYYYKVSALDVHGNESPYALLAPDGVTGASELPAAWDYLEQNVPNPFNPVTRIRFGLSSAGEVSLRVYDVSGRLVRTLVEGPLAAGPHGSSWDGRDDRGRPVSSGIYFLRLQRGSFVKVRKMVLAR